MVVVLGLVIWVAALIAGWPGSSPAAVTPMWSRHCAASQSVSLPASATEHTLMTERRKNRLACGTSAAA